MTNIMYPNDKYYVHFCIDNLFLQYFVTILNAMLNYSFERIYDKVASSGFEFVTPERVYCR